MNSRSDGLGNENMAFMSSSVEIFFCLRLPAFLSPQPNFRLKRRLSAIHFVFGRTYATVVVAPVMAKLRFVWLCQLRIQSLSETVWAKPERRSPTLTFWSRYETSLWWYNGLHVHWLTLRMGSALVCIMTFLSVFEKGTPMLPRPVSIPNAIFPRF